MSLRHTLQAEFLKTKRTSLIYVCVIGAAFIPFFMLFNLNTEEDLKMLRPDPWNVFYREVGMGFNILFIPMYVTLICTLLPQLEYRNNTWKQVFSSPQPLGYVFVAKFVVVHAFVLACYLIYNLLLALTLFVKQASTPSLGLFEHSIDWSNWLIRNGISYASILAVSAIQFWAGLRFKSFVAPVGIGFGSWIAAVVMISEFKWRQAAVFPYAIPGVVVFPKYAPEVPFLLWCSAGYTLLFLGLAYVDFRRTGAKQ